MSEHVCDVKIRVETEKGQVLGVPLLVLLQKIEEVFSWGLLKENQGCETWPLDVVAWAWSLQERDLTTDGDSDSGGDIGGSGGI